MLKKNEVFNLIHISQKLHAIETPHETHEYELLLSFRYQNTFNKN